MISLSRVLRGKHPSGQLTTRKKALFISRLAASTPTLRPIRAATAPQATSPPLGATHPPPAPPADRSPPVRGFRAPPGSRAGGKRSRPPLPRISATQGSVPRCSLVHLCEPHAPPPGAITPSLPGSLGASIPAHPAVAQSRPLPRPSSPHSLPCDPPGQSLPLAHPPLLHRHLQPPHCFQPQANPDPEPYSSLRPPLSATVSHPNITSPSPGGPTQSVCPTCRQGGGGVTSRAPAAERPMEDSTERQPGDNGLALSTDRPSLDTGDSDRTPDKSSSIDCGRRGLPHPLAHTRARTDLEKWAEEGAGRAEQEERAERVEWDECTMERVQKALRELRTLLAGQGNVHIIVLLCCFLGSLNYPQTWGA